MDRLLRLSGAGMGGMGSGQGASDAPVVDTAELAGLDPVTFEPYICNMDLIGTELHSI